MKKIIKFFALFALLSFVSNSAIAQDKSTTAISDAPVELNFAVSGVCNMCKSKIENAALIKGVKFANWDKSSKVLTIVYKPNKVEPIQVHESIAKVGYDTSKLKGEEKAYSKLPKCCRYRSGIETH